MGITGNHYNTRVRIHWLDFMVHQPTTIQLLQDKLQSVFAVFDTQETLLTDGRWYFMHYLIYTISAQKTHAV